METQLKIKYLIILSFYALNIVVFPQFSFCTEEAIVTINGHQSDDEREQNDETEDTNQDGNERLERVRELWNNLPQEVAQEQMGGIIEEELREKAAATALQSKCILNNSVPLRINNVSDLNVLIETEEPSLGTIKRIKQVVKQGEESFFCAPFKRSARVVISTESKRIRDQTILEGNAQLRAMNHDNIEDDNARTLATRVALKDHENAKLKRVQQGNIELKFKAKDYYRSQQEAVENAGLILLIENDPNPEGQILVSVSKPVNWDESSDEESASENEPEQNINRNNNLTQNNKKYSLKKVHSINESITVEEFIKSIYYNGYKLAYTTFEPSVLSVVKFYESDPSKALRREIKLKIGNSDNYVDLIPTASALKLNSGIQNRIVTKLLWGSKDYVSRDEAFRLLNILDSVKIVHDRKDLDSEKYYCINSNKSKPYGNMKLFNADALMGACGKVSEDDTDDGRVILELLCGLKVNVKVCDLLEISGESFEQDTLLEESIILINAMSEYSDCAALDCGIEILFGGSEWGRVRRCLPFYNSSEPIHKFTFFGEVKWKGAEYEKSGKMYKTDWLRLRDKKVCNANWPYSEIGCSNNLPENIHGLIRVLRHNPEGLQHGPYPEMEGIIETAAKIHQEIPNFFSDSKTESFRLKEARKGLLQAYYLYKKRDTSK